MIITTFIFIENWRKTKYSMIITFILIEKRRNIKHSIFNSKYSVNMHIFL